MSKQVFQFILRDDENKRTTVEELVLDEPNYELEESGEVVCQSTLIRLLTQQLWEIQGVVFQSKAYLKKKLKEGANQKDLDYHLGEAFDDIETKIRELKYS